MSKGEGIGFRCFGEHVLVKPTKTHMTPGGIALPDPDNFEQGQILMVKTGEVVAVGPGTYLDNGDLMKCEARVGMKVEYYSYSTRGARSRVICGVEVDCIKDQDIIGCVEP